MRALVSVSDKTGLVPFVQGLQALGWTIIATGGTQKLLESSGVKTVGISEVTGFPEILDGRVKTLHPKVHGGILARRDLPAHMQTLAEQGIETIDLVCVNLYPFRQTIAKEGVSMEDAIENIDIGGPSMVRSAAKNWRDVTIVCDPNDYDRVLDELRANGKTSDETRLQLSAKAYTHTAEYDMCISSWMRKQAGLNEKLFLEYDLKQGLRYGENPHQAAKFYASMQPAPYSLAFAKQIQGKELSYNNIQDANAALNVLRDFSDKPFCVALKHMNPCGAAVGATIEEAWQAAYEADKVSIYGGIVGVNRELTAEVAAGMKPIFLEIVIAPNPFCQEESPRAGGADGPRGRGADAVRWRERRHARAAARHRRGGGEAGNVRDQGPAHGGAARRPRFRLAHRQACQVQRHRGGARQPHHRRGRRPDQSRRLRRNRPQAGAGGRIHRGAHPGLRRFPPVRRHRGAGRAVRRDRHRAAGRQHP